MTLPFKLLAAAGVVAITSFSAQAATCSSGSVTYTLDQGVPDAVLASGCFAGNDTSTIDAAVPFLGFTGWTLGDKTDGPDGSHVASFSSFTFGPDYAWTVTNPLGYNFVMVTLKQATSFAAFVLDTTKPLSGTWFTEGPGRAEGDLSHASVYYSGRTRTEEPPPPPPPPPVPLPAAGWLLLASIGGLVAVRRKRA